MKNKISKLRKKIKISQEELAKLAGVNQQVIIALEGGRYNPSLELTAKITKALNQKNISDVFGID